MMKMNEKRWFKMAGIKVSDKEMLKEGFEMEKEEELEEKCDKSLEEAAPEEMPEEDVDMPSEDMPPEDTEMGMEEPEEPHMEPDGDEAPMGQQGQEELFKQVMNAIAPILGVDVAIDDESVGEEELMSDEFAAEPEMGMEPEMGEEEYDEDMLMEIVSKVTKNVMKRMKVNKKK